jgi:flagellar basal-body rod protein FlgF
MDNTVLISLSHQLAAYRSMDVIANNLANAQTPAFKREAVKFEEAVSRVASGDGQSGQQSVSFVEDKGVVRDLTEGQLNKTGAPFDLAIHGDGYFVVRTANGDRYTRNGHFTLDPQGRIVTSAGDQLQGEGGPITITPDDGDVHIAQDGTVTGKQGQLGKVRLVNFDDERALVKQGASLYNTDQPPIPVEKPHIEQGMLENSNVEPVVEISHMIEVMRAYQASANLTQTGDDLKRQAITKLGSMPSA